MILDFCPQFHKIPYHNFFRKSSFLISPNDKIPKMVPTLTSLCIGTIVTTFLPATSLCKATWLPVCLETWKPKSSTRIFIILPAESLGNFDTQCTNHVHVFQGFFCIWHLLKIKSDCLLDVCQCLFDGISLSCHSRSCLFYHIRAVFLPKHRLQFHTLCLHSNHFNLFRMTASPCRFGSMKQC